MKHETIDLVRPCPVCGAGQEEAEPFLADSRDDSRLTGASFASRKLPEYMSHAMVRCRTCDLAYVDRPPSQALLAASYHAADYDSAEEAEDAADAYAGAMARVLSALKGRRAALEIGTGTGAFLDRLRDAGFSTTVGVEPSRAAIDAAPLHRKDWIREAIFVEEDYAPASFDLICCFMTLEHVREPGALVSSALRLLRPGGVFVGVTHDRRAWINRLLGRRSPIVDIEHMQLFSAESVKQLLRRAGFHDVGASSFRNSYRPSYWLRLVPLPDSVKNPLAAKLRGSVLDRRRITVNVGNVLSWGFKPVEG